MRKALQTGEVRRWLGALTALIGVLGWMHMGCDSVEIGGLDNEEEVGRQERGRDPGSYWVHEGEREYDPETGEYEAPPWLYFTSYSDVILSPDGANLLAMVPKPGPDKGWDEPGMVLVVKPLPVGTFRVFEEITDVVRLNFSPDGDYAFALVEEGKRLHAINLRTFEVEQSTWLSRKYSVVDVTPDGRFAVLSNLPTEDWQQDNQYDDLDAGCYQSGAGNNLNLCALAVVNLETGKVESHLANRRLRDLDFSPVDGELLLTFSHWVDTGDAYLPETTIAFFDPETALPVATTAFPNCADEVVVDKARRLALLAPIRCTPPPHPSQVQAPPENIDPISVIDLETRKFVTNLPGFGPVVLAGDGDTAVGFTRRQTLIDEWSYFDQETPVGLIFVDLDTLDWEIINYGDQEPAYTVSPDGRRLYLFENETHHWVKGSDGKWHSTYANSGLKQFDLETRTWLNLTTQSTDLDRLVWSADGQSMYFLSEHKLYRLDKEAETVSFIPTYGTPDNINLRPQQDYLILGEADAPVFYLLARNSQYAATFVDLGNAL